MSKLSDIAKQTVGGGSLTSGLQKLQITDIIKHYNGVVTINGVEVVKLSDGKTFPAFTFVEDETCSFNGGKALREMVDAWLETFGGDIDGINRELREEPIRIRLARVKTKRGTDFTTVAILGAVKPQVEDDDEEEVDYDPETGEVRDGTPF